MAESEGVIPDLHKSVGKDCSLKGPARIESITSNHTDAVWENDTFEGTTVGVHIFRYLHKLCSAVNVAKMKGVHTITQDSLKTGLSENRSSDQLLELPWSQTIEDGASKNIAMLRSMFKSNSKGVQL